MQRTFRHLLTTVSITFTCAALSPLVSAESLRCKGSLVDVGASRLEVIKKCGEPEATDSYCEKSQHRVLQADGTYTLVESCEDVEVWTYERGRGKFATDLLFAQGKIREIRYGDRSE